MNLLLFLDVFSEGDSLTAWLRQVVVEAEELIVAPCDSYLRMRLLLLL